VAVQQKGRKENQQVPGNNNVFGNENFGAVTNVKEVGETHPFVIMIYAQKLAATCVENANN